MIREDQKKWLNHLSSDTKIKIIPYDPSSQEKFEKIQLLLRLKLGNHVQIEHCGATNLKISGQDEIDIYIPVSQNDFNNFLNPLVELFGEPHSHYTLERARFVTFERGKHVDVFLINKDGAGWIDGQRFENYLKSNPQALEEYKKLKESGHGLGVKEYYERKIEFINKVLEIQGA